MLTLLKRIVSLQKLLVSLQRSDMVVSRGPPQDHLACGLSACLQKASGRQFKSRNLVYELTASQVNTGSAWKLYTCCAAVTLVSGTRVAPGLHPGTPTGVKVFFVVCHKLKEECNKD